MDYQSIQRDFVERTLQIIDQYEELVRQHMPPENQFEVTLLLNCLLGLLVYPQQIAGRNGGHDFNEWLTEDLVVNVGGEWGIDPSFVLSPGHKKMGRTDVSITLEQLTIRNLIRQMRNMAAHARFEAVPTHLGNQISEIVFHDVEREDGFHLVLPVKNLEVFVRKLAESYLEAMTAAKRKR